MSTSSTPQTTTGPFDAVHVMINNRPQTPNNLQAFVSWLITVINAILAMIEQIGQANDARLTELEEVTDSHATTLEQSVANATAATAAPATTQWQQRDTTTSRRLPSRCNLCHACGHTSTDCKTTNPGAMRKRVARNSRIAKEARAPITTSHIPVQAPPSFFYHQPSPHVAPVPMNYAALAADATELRRRAAQSARDKRRKRPSTSS
jgi:cell division septum initiation protein DivIVA